MIDYGLKDKVALVTGANNPQGIGAAAALAFAGEGAKVVLVYKRISRIYDEKKTEFNGADKYYKSNAGNADITAQKLSRINADYLVLENDISNPEDVSKIYAQIMDKYGRVDILVERIAKKREY